MKKTGITLTELLAASVLFSFATTLTIDNISSYQAVGIKLVTNQTCQETRFDIISDISSSIRQASKIYPEEYEIIIPTRSSYAHTFNGLNSIAFRAKDNNIAFSIIPEYEWFGSGSENFILVKTVIENTGSMADKENETLDFSSGKSEIIAINLKPAIFKNLEYNSFLISTKYNKIDFSLIAKPEGIYFPSYYGWKMIDDSNHISSVLIEKG